MNAHMRLSKNAVWMVISRFGAQGLAVVFTILIARRLGSADFGAYAFIAAIIFVGNALTTFGTDMLLIREIAAQDDLSRLPASLAVQLVLSALIVVFVWLFGASIPNQNTQTIAALKIYSLSLIPLAFFTVFTIALRGKQRMDAYMLLNLTIAGLQITVMFVPNLNLMTLAVFLLSIQTSIAVVSGLTCVAVIPHFWQAWNVSSVRFTAFLRDAAPIAFITLLGMLYQRQCIYLLSTISGAAPTGIFSAAVRVVDASKAIHLAVFAALYPALAAGMSLQDAASYSKSKQIALTYFKYLLAGALLITLVLFALASPLVKLLYGQEFSPSANILRIIAWTLVPFTINTYLTLSLLASKQEKKIARALMASLLGLLILNLGWIPSKGAEGSAWAMLIAECIQSIILLESASSHVSFKVEEHELSNLS
jgi:O-antigen/teichoic acid export membrane protein